jgi:hypothetical protein
MQPQSRPWNWAKSHLPLANGRRRGHNREMPPMNRTFLKIVAWMLILAAPRACAAGVVVLQNLTPVKIEFSYRLPDGKEGRQAIVPTDIASIPATGPVLMTLGEGPASHSFTLDLNSIHYFVVQNGMVQFVHLKLPGVDPKPQEKPPQAGPPGQAPTSSQAPRQLPQPAHPAAQADPIYKIPVAIYTDSVNPHLMAAWEKKIRKRLDEASDIFEHHCRVRFEVVKVGSWDSDTHIRAFDQSLMEFAMKVRPHPARVAIGFTTHYQWLPGETHLGGTHGALASHVLIRESPGQVSEPERLEVLVHELGHFLGSAHTSDKTSVMRPVLGDRQSASKNFRIGFDAPNTLVMSLVAEEMRTRHIWHPSVLSPDSKIAVRGAYMVLAQTIPQDPTSTSAVESLGQLPAQPEPTGGLSPELIHGAQHVVRAVVQAARENQQLPVRSKVPRAQVWRSDDELTTYYVRRAAAAARQLPPRTAPSAFLLGLGIAMDDSAYVRDKPALNDVWQKIETDELRQARLLLLGTPTMLKRHNLTRHFMLSATLVVLTGPQGAEAAGLGNEMLESRKGEGFSFADLCADMSGVLFATHVRDGDIPLDIVAARFTVEDYVPKLDGLPNDLTWENFVNQYGGANSENFHRQRADIFRRILALPAYRAPETQKKK